MRPIRLAASLLVLVCALEGAAGVAQCPEDSVPRVVGEGCVCKGTCAPPSCRPGQRAVLFKTENLGEPGNCCPRYDCVPSGNDSCPEDSGPADEGGGCKCLPTCPPHKCPDGERPVIVRAAAKPETPGNCCPLYECVPSEPVSWIETDTEEDKSKRTGPKECIHNGITRKPGEKWQESACFSCSCDSETGEAHCQGPMCKPCEVPTPVRRGECCPRCDRTPVIGRDRCDILRKCNVICERYALDERGCPTCECAEQKPDVNEDVEETSGKICPELKCDLHCKHGLLMDENDCTLCECRTAQQSQPSDCPSLDCKKKCPFGYRTNKRGCPTCRCRASCTDHLNKTHAEGTTWQPDSCTKCSCETGGRLTCKEIVCSVGCADPLPPKPGTCCPVCPIINVTKDGNSTTIQRMVGRGWGTVPITLIVILTMLCLLLIIHIVRTRFRGRLSPSEISYAYTSYPSQYYKCVPAYDPAVPPSSATQPTTTTLHRTQKIVPL